MDDNSIISRIFGRPDEERERKEKCMDKLTWPTLEAANAAVAYARWQYGDEHNLKAYRCKYCDKWHLSGA